MSEDNEIIPKPLNEGLSLKEKLQQWVTDLISRFREETEKLAPGEQSTTPRILEDFSEPCQFLVIWAKEPEFQIVLITHLTQLEDKHIEIYGPMENAKLVEFIEKEVLKSQIIELIGRECIEDFFASKLRSIQRFYNPLYGPPKPSIGERTRRKCKDQCIIGWLVIGNLLDFDSTQIASRYAKAVLSAAHPPYQPPLREEKEKLILEGFGTYIYPPIWVGKIPEPKSFKEKIAGQPFWISQKKVIIDAYKNCPIVVTRDGYIAIGEKDKWKAQELLNEIMSTLLLRGIVAQAVREIDLGEATFTETGAGIGWSPISPRALLFYEKFLTRPISVEKTVVNEDRIRKTIKLAELLTSDDRVKTLLLLYLEAHTYYMNTEYKQALMMGWIILEDFYIKDLWSSEILKVTSNEKRLSKLGSWNIDQRLEALNLSYALSTEEYNLLMEIKDARNNVVHEGKIPQKEIVQKCLELAFKVVKNYIGKHLGEKLPQL